MVACRPDIDMSCISVDYRIVILKSVRVHFAYARIALMLELLGRFGRFLDEDDRCNPPVLLIPFPRLLGL